MYEYNKITKQIVRIRIQHDININKQINKIYNKHYENRVNSDNNIKSSQNIKAAISRGKYSGQ